MSSTMTLLTKVVLILMILTATKAGKKKTCQKKSKLFASTCSKKGNGNLQPLQLVFAEMKYTMGGYVAGRLIDTHLNNFAHTVDSTDGVWIRVKLAQVDTIKQINIYNRQDCCQDRIVGLSVYIKRDDTVVTDCGKITHATSTYTFNCVGLGNVVELGADGRISQQNIAEIKVLGSTSGYQQLSFESAEMKNTLGGYRAERLIDNDYNNFAHTTDSSDGIWIRAKLAQTKNIKLIRIGNRKGCCQDRIVGISVYIKQDDTVVTKCGTISAVHESYDFNCRGRGNIVELSAEGTISQQNIAEIAAFGTNPGYTPKLLMDCEVNSDILTNRKTTECDNTEKFLQSKCSMEQCPDA